MPAKVPASECRTLDQLREQYEVECELGDRLRHATKTERRDLYRRVYNELFQRVPHHPQIARVRDRTLQRNKTRAQVRALEPFLNADVAFLELGAGDCSLAFEVANRVAQAYAVDVSDEIATDVNAPDNFRLILSDGSSVPLEADSVDLAYSYQLMEHLHPDDSEDQLREIHRVLKRGGRYVCVTPNRVSGPWDISRYFDDVARGVHLKEFTNGELADLFRRVGFTTVRVYVRAKGMYVLSAVTPVRMLERVLMRLPVSLRQRVGFWYPFRVLLGIQLVATK